jgi:hypothetical protein
VVIGSPLHAIAAYERELRLDPNAVDHTGIRSGPTGAWSRLERGELELEEFYPRRERLARRRQPVRRRAGWAASRKARRAACRGRRRGLMPSGRVRFLTDDEEPRLREQLDSSPWQIVEFAFNTGLRQQKSS